MQKKKTKDNERHTKKKWSLFYVGQILLARNLPWSVMDILSDTLLKKIDFPFLEGIYKFPTAS